MGEHTLTADNVRQLFDYDPETGHFRWRTVRASQPRPGTIAGSIHAPDGYRRIRLNRRRYYAHRLIWLYHHGEWPDGQIDHRNGDRADNRIANLRLVTHAGNAQNTRKKKSNRSGFPGVLQTSSGKWSARLRADGRFHYLGTFATAEEAYRVYVKAKREMHPLWATGQGAGVQPDV